MYIVIAGGGIAGSALAKELANKKHDVVVIDVSKEACERLYATTGVIAVNGSASEIETLKEAGIEKADLAIGALYLDVDNLTFALLARSLGVSRIIVKMRNPAYEEAYKTAGVTSICDMISMIRTRVMTEIETKNMRVIAPIREGKMQLVMFEVPSGWPKEGITIRELAKHKEFSGDYIFAGVFKMEDERLYTPHGNDVLYAGDRVFMVADFRMLQAVSTYLSAFGN